MICSGCKKEFERKHGNQFFCTTECQQLSKLDEWKDDFKRKDAKQVRQLRTCLGILCRGQKMFKSAGPFNRVCEACKKASESIDTTLVVPEKVDNSR